MLTVFLKIQMRKCFFLFDASSAVLIEINNIQIFSFRTKKNNDNLKRLIFYKKKQQFITVLSQKKKMTTIKNQSNETEFSFVLNIS